MKFWYDIIDTRCLEINFEELFDIIKERLLEDEPEVSVYDVYQEFIDKVKANGVIFTFDASSGKAVKIERVCF